MLSCHVPCTLYLLAYRAELREVAIPDRLCYSLMERCRSMLLHFPSSCAEGPTGGKKRSPERTEADSSLV